MTHKVLQSDIDFARKQLQAMRPDAEIIAALERRRIDPEKAAQLVYDLREGKQVSPELDRVPQVVPGPSSEATEEPRDPQDEALAAPDHPRSAKGSTRGRPSRRKRSVGMWALALLAVVAASAIFLMIYPDSSKLWSRATRGQSSSEQPVERPEVRAQITAVKGPDLELHSNGLYIAEHSITRSNAHVAFASAFGPATRTNEVGRPSKLVYAYDRHGLLVYCQRGGSDESVLIDFEALGGNDGTQQRFTGTLKVEGSVIRGDTDAKTLCAINTLGLKDANSESLTFGGHYGAVDLVFTYQKDRRRLSSIEIDLK